LSAAADAAATVVTRCRELARISDIPGQTTRTFLSAATRQAHALVCEWMQAAGLRVWTDAIGNVRGVLEGATADAPRLLIGSHLDTVIDAGAFDGPLGVVLGIALAGTMAAEGPLPFALELIAFSEEEGVRFAKPFLSSLAVVGELDQTTLALEDAKEVTVRQALVEFGLDPGALANAVVDAATFGYVEFHIEQGPVLDEKAESLGVVEAIAGQTRIQVTFCGRA
jgi:allantoate deiminase